MYARKILAGLILAGLSAGAFAQAATHGKTDIFGRPYVNETAADAYYQGEPFGVSPQAAQARRVEAAHSRDGNND